MQSSRMRWRLHVCIVYADDENLTVHTSQHFENIDLASAIAKLLRRLYNTNSFCARVSGTLQSHARNLKKKKRSILLFRTTER